MIKLFFFTILLSVALFAKSSQPSNIPLPEVSVLNLDPYPCDAKCLQNYLKKGLIFSYLAHQTADIQAQMLQTEKISSTALATNEPKRQKTEQLKDATQQEQNIQKKAYSSTKIRIALLLPHKAIGRYTVSTTNASFAYLMSRGSPFELKTYKIENQNYEEIQKALRNIEADGFKYVIAPLTQVGEKIITQINPELFIYFPTINKKDTQTSSSYLYYGAIDYRAQIDTLLQEAHSPLVIFCDESEVGRQLCTYEESAYAQTKGSGVTKYVVTQQMTNLEKQIKDNPKLRGGSVFLNTPVVKSGMIMSQLTLYDTSVANILSAQANYNPLLLSMTQYRDRKDMIIANSITHNDELLIETNSVMENDIAYDWINYTTTVGIDYFAYAISGEQRMYNIALKDNQMVYPIVLLKPETSRFVPYR
ncbi:MAG: hypothetical protein OEL19_06900 [Sulfurimonas sp.]|nr:hypothetical protein [Sulfurimonas sp.]